MFTRRRFLVIFPVFAASAHAQTVWPLKKKKPIAPPPPLNVYIGTDTAKNVSKGIYQALAKGFVEKTELRRDKT